MPLPLKDRKIGAVEYVIKRLKGSDSYDRMKEHNEHSKGGEYMAAREDAEKDYSTACKIAVNEMLEAVETKNAQLLEKSLKAIISMMLDVREDEDEMQKQAEIEHLKRGEG